MAFEDIRDQAVPVRLLKNLIGRGRVPNAMLFWGPGGVGKRMTATEMAKAVNCSGKGEKPCGTCLSCRKVVSGNHPDVQYVVPVKKSRTIDVEAVESVTEMATLRPFEGQWRVFIFQDADRMRHPAQNHFLKTLEEPPGNSLFLLVTEFPGLLLPTIRSRCQMVRFGRLSPTTVAAILQRERGLDEHHAQAVASLAQGQMTRAFDLVDSEKRTAVAEITRRLAAGDDPVELAEEFTKLLDDQKKQVLSTVKEAFVPDRDDELGKADRERQQEEQNALVDALCRRDTMEYLYLFETWYRDALVYGATAGAGAILNRDYMERLEAAQVRDPESKINAIDTARRYLERFLNEERVFRDLFFVLAE